MGLGKGGRVRVVGWWGYGERGEGVGMRVVGVVGGWEAWMSREGRV